MNPIRVSKWRTHNKEGQDLNRSNPKLKSRRVAIIAISLESILLNLKKKEEEKKKKNEYCYGNASQFH